MVDHEGSVSLSVDASGALWAGEHRYPAPVVDIAQTYRHARDRLWALKKDPAVRRERERILRRHVERRADSTTSAQ